jgi:hypothetical protein
LYKVEAFRRNDCFSSVSIEGIEARRRPKDNRLERNLQCIRIFSHPQQGFEPSRVICVLRASLVEAVICRLSKTSPTLLERCRDNNPFFVS